MRSTRILTISLSPILYKDAAKVAKQERRTTSELFREALRKYIEQKRWNELVEYGTRKALEAGIKTEEDVERIMDELRG